MIKGLELFVAHFSAYRDRYVLIGGTACTLIMEKAGLQFRATKDLDIVLCVETIDGAFVNAFWAFVKAGGYKNQQQSTGKKLFYRFFSPSDDRFPSMLELFSRKPDALALRKGSHLTPISVDDEASSLSAILLDGDYYTLLLSSTSELQGVTLVSAQYLIPLKARAYINLVAIRDEGSRVDEKDIRKHKNDVFRLYQVLSPETRVALPESVKTDMRQFLDQIVGGGPVDLKSLGLRNTTTDEVMRNLRLIYGLGNG
jgi:hypothetical protein